jgi:hypothetical protein
VMPAILGHALSAGLKHSPRPNGSSSCAPCNAGGTLFGSTGASACGPGPAGFSAHAGASACTRQPPEPPPGPPPAGHTDGPCERPDPQWPLITGWEASSWTGGLGRLATPDVQVWLCLSESYMRPECAGDGPWAGGGRAWSPAARYVFLESARRLTYWGPNKALRLLPDSDHNVHHCLPKISTCIGNAVAKASAMLRLGVPSLQLPAIVPRSVLAQKRPCASYYKV